MTIILFNYPYVAYYENIFLMKGALKILRISAHFRPPLHMRLWTFKLKKYVLKRERRNLIRLFFGGSRITILVNTYYTIKRLDIITAAFSRLIVIGFYINDDKSNTHMNIFFSMCTHFSNLYKYTYTYTLYT